MSTPPLVRGVGPEEDEVVIFEGNPLEKTGEVGPTEKILLVGQEPLNFSWCVLEIPTGAETKLQRPHLETAHWNQQTHRW